jgi:hypothetical protein
VQFGTVFDRGFLLKGWLQEPYYVRRYFHRHAVYRQRLPWLGFTTLFQTGVQDVVDHIDDMEA